MQWADVLQDQSLQDLPYKIELNEWGQIVMTPASNQHGLYQSKIGWILMSCMTGGSVISECSIATDAGVKVADVAWCSESFLQQHGVVTPFMVAPELCVEITSPSNSDRQMQEKLALYFDRGAKECWLVAETGEVCFFDREGERGQSSFGIEVVL